MAGADVSSTSGHKFPEGRHVLRLGDSYLTKTAPSYHTMRYDFKPASVGDCKETYVEVAENQEVTVTVPKLDETGEVRDATVFKGPRKAYQKECLLIYNHETGEFVLEQLAYNIQLKKTRGEVTDDVLKGIRDTRKKLMHSVGSDGILDGASSSVVGQVSARNDVGHEEDAEMMSDSGGSQSESDSSDEGEASDDAHSDAEPEHMENGEFSEDELAKSLEAELAPSQESSNMPRSQSNFSNPAPRQNAPQPPSSRLHEDLLLSESSDED